MRIFAPACEPIINISTISAARMASSLMLLGHNVSRPRAWLNKYFRRELAAELGLPVFVTMPNIRRLIDELNGSAE